MIAVAVALSLSWSCEKAPVDEGKENTGNENTGNENTGNENQGGTIATITAAISNSTAKAAWAEGDAILVYAVIDGADVAAKYVLSGGAGTATGTFTPSAAALATGATAYFATYPYNEDMTFAQHNTFAFTLEAEQSVDTPIFAYAEDATNLTFSSPVGAVKIPLKGKGGIARVEVTDNDSKAILNGNVTYNPKTTKFSIKNSAASKNVITKVLAEKVELGETAVDFVVEVPAGAFKTGGVMVLYDVNNSPLANINIPNLTVEAGKVAAIDAVTVEPVAQTVNLNITQGYANTYQIAAVGKYKFEAVKGNSSDKLAAAAAELTWETWCNNEAVTANSLVKSVAVEDGYVVVETADEFHAGNALVSVKNAEGTIIWSWMLWFVEGTIGTVEVDGVVIMDRNLGALTTDKTKPGLNYGLLWQWGRSVPVMGLDGTHNTEEPTAMTCTPAIEGERVRYDDEGVGAAKGEVFTVDYVIANPTKFFYSGLRNWYKGTLDEVDASHLWLSTKTIYDPCPAGYQVMCYETAKAVFAGYSESVENDQANFGFTLNGQWYPYTGRWKYGESSRYTDATMTWFWTVDTQYKDEANGWGVASMMKFEEGAGDTTYESKGSALTVRCEVTPAN